MRILLLDVETAPNVAYVWGLWQQNVAINQIEASGYILCWSAKWLGDDQITFDSIQKSGPEKMLRRMHKLMDAADVVVTYNGNKFDIPTLNKEFLLYGFTPPAPYKNLDLYQVVKRVFRFESNKLDYIAQSLGLGNKVKHEGFELWLKCMAGDKEAWQTMENYNRQDVALLEQVYFRILPWIRTHPNHGAYTDIACCPTCGSERLQRRGKAVAKSKVYRRYQCQECGAWSHGKEVEKPTPEYRQITG